MTSDDRAMELFFELFSGLPRQGPGDAASTRRALALVPPLGADGRILDIGCGTGTQTLDLAAATPARITAVDIHPPFVESLNRRAAELGYADRVRAEVGDMARLDYPPGHFDLVWSEGAVYFLGVEAALEAWRELLAPGGHIAMSQLCWLDSDPPTECVDYFEAEYPEMTGAAELRSMFDRAGYSLLGDFPLPQSAWWEPFYEPLERNLASFRDRWAEDATALAIAEQTEREIDIFRRFGDVYGYLFLIGRDGR